MSTHCGKGILKSGALAGLACRIFPDVDLLRSTLINTDFMVMHNVGPKILNVHLSSLLFQLENKNTVILYLDEASCSFLSDVCLTLSWLFQLKLLRCYFFSSCFSYSNFPARGTFCSVPMGLVLLRSNVGALCSPVTTVAHVRLTGPKSSSILIKP